MGTRFISAALSLAASLWLAAIPARAANPTAAAVRVFTNSVDTRGLFEDLPLEPRAPALPRSEGAASLTTTTNTAAPAVGRMETLDDKQKLAIGDRITFRVLEEQEEARALTITDAGELDVPELGLVKVAGKTCKQLAYELKPKLEQAAYYRATVIVALDVLNRTPSGRRVYVEGEVVRPGMQEIPGGETLTVSRAIIRAGGFTLYADKKRVRLNRAGKTLVVNVASILGGKASEDLPLQAEDVISVPERGFTF